MYGKHHTIQEREWLRNELINLPDRPKTAFIRKLLITYNKKFPVMQEKPFHSLCSREWHIAKGLDYKIPQPEKRSYNKGATPRKINKVFSMSQYILYVNGSIFGFETEEEVEAFLTSNQILGQVKAFINLPIKIKTSVKIGKSADKE